MNIYIYIYIYTHIFIYLGFLLVGVLVVLVFPGLGLIGCTPDVLGFWLKGWPCTLHCENSSPWFCAGLVSCASGLHHHGSPREGCFCSYGPLSSSFLGLPYRILNIDRGLWVCLHFAYVHPRRIPQQRGLRCVRYGSP